jgi:hypothetical protein
MNYHYDTICNTTAIAAFAAALEGQQKQKDGGTNTQQLVLPTSGISNNHCLIILFVSFNSLSFFNTVCSFFYYFMYVHYQ